MTAASKRIVGRPFQPGQSGNPGGRRPAVLSRAVFARLTAEQADAIATTLIERAVAGEAWAIQAVWDRTEGKVPNRNEDGKPGDFDMDLSDLDENKIRAAITRIK